MPTATFVGYGNADDRSPRPAFLAEDVETPVFVRFSTVLGSRGSADTVRDTRGFATKFYTDEGTFDLVGNNIPVFFIQDGIKFPDVIHAGKPHPDREIPQAQSAHDTFWDFVSLHTEAQHHTIWNMSDRGIPRSYRTMEGFGVHTFRCVNAPGETSLVKFHWKPRLGVHSLVWEEAQLLARHRPRLPPPRPRTTPSSPAPSPPGSSASRSSPTPRSRPSRASTCSTRPSSCPRSWRPVQPIGMLTLTRNPTNFFAETEQVAFHVGHLVPGIDVTDDPLLQARLFSYVDTQLTRLGGPNFSQIPINRPHAPVNDMQRDGFHQHAVHGGVAPYRPNSLDGGCPFLAGAEDGAFVDVPVTVPEATKVRENPGVVRRPLQPGAAVLAEHDPGRAGAHRAGLHLRARQVLRAGRSRSASSSPWPTSTPSSVRRGRRRASGLPAPERTVEYDEPDAQPGALPARRQTWPTDGRVIGIVVDPDGDLAGVEDGTPRRCSAAGMVPLVIGPHGGELGDGTGGAAHLRHRALGRVRRRPGRAAPRHRPRTRCVARDSKAGELADPRLDPRVALLARGVLPPRQGDRRLGRRAWPCWRPPVASRRRGRDRRRRSRGAGRRAGADGAHRVWERFDPA